MSGIEKFVTESEYTGYGIATVLNKILSASGAERVVRPQMMYNYLRNGLVVRGEKIFGETLRTVTRTEVIEFLERYCKRNAIKVSDENENQLELFEL